MEKIKTWFREYLKKSSKWKIASDVFFYIFIILLIIPATRKPISSTLIRLTMRKPDIEKSAVPPEIVQEDRALLFEDLAGNTYQLGDFDGEVILLNFWATWCPPCRAEMPSIQKLYDDYGSKIAMILISSEEKEVIESYLREQSYDLPVYIQRTALTPSFPVRSIPTTFLINKKGEILLEKKGAANWNSEEFRKQLDELIQS
jgi:thiol-disulfide isomerase/thioredoxin